METIDQLIHQSGRMCDPTTTVSDAGRGFARAANGNNDLIIGAPTGHELISSIKCLLSGLKKIANRMPRGFAASFNDPRLKISDRDHITGEEKDPDEQTVIATEQLKALSTTLDAGSDHSETAQSAINSQGYNPKDVKS